MTKHFVGLGLFSFIVAVFAFAFWLITPEPVAEVFVAESNWRPAPRTYCDLEASGSRRLDSPRAIADRRTGTLTIYLNEIPGGSRIDSREVRATFTFYASSGDNVRLVDVISDSLVKEVRRDSGPRWILQYQADWVSHLSRSENLYVVPLEQEGAIPAAFSQDLAMPVLIAN